MRLKLLSAIVIAGFVGLLPFTPAPSSAKTVAECNADYAANKDAIKASGQKKKDFMASCRAEAAPATATTPTASATPAALPSAAAGKSAKDCNAEYAANKEAIKASGQKKKDFVAACKAGTETIPTPAAAAATPTTAPAPVQPTPTVAATPTPAPTPTKMAPAAAGAGGVATEAQAKARCPSDTVVWVNTKSGVYHFAGTHNYGTTKQGQYMCEADAKAAGDRAAENEKHP